MAAFACVIGNPSSGSAARPKIVEDVARVVTFLQKRGVVIVNDTDVTGLTSVDMKTAFAKLAAAAAGAGNVSLFYYCGHALESRSPKDIFLLGQDAMPDSGAVTAHALSLMETLRAWATVDGLKILVLDGCRLADDGDAKDGLWQSFEEVHWDFIRAVPDLFIITASTSGKAAYQGQFTAALLERAEAIGSDDDELEMSLEGWLRNALGDIAKKKRSVQRPSLFCYAKTQEWTIGDLIGSAPMSLDEATKRLDAAIEEVRTGNNGIQFIVTSVCAPAWQPPRSTPFLAEDHSTNPKTDLAPLGAAAKIRIVADEEGGKAYNKMREGKLEDSGFATCKDIPDPFSKNLLHRWRCEPNKYFIFLAGGVGPQKKADDFLKFSESELDPKTGKLAKVLEQYAEAYLQAHKRT